MRQPVTYRIGAGPQAGCKLLVMRWIRALAREDPATAIGIGVTTPTGETPYLATKRISFPLRGRAYCCAREGVIRLSFPASQQFGSVQGVVKVLVAIPHFHDARGAGGHGSTGPKTEARLAAIRACLLGLRQALGPNQAMMYRLREYVPGHGNGELVQVNAHKAEVLDIAICVSGTQHLLDRLDLPAGFYHRQPVRGDPALLGFGCQHTLRANLGRYDYYCYLEDDLLLQDPFFLAKVSWFNALFGDETMLLPHRFEVEGSDPVDKLYIDGPVSEEFTAKWQDVNDRRYLRAEAFGSEITFARSPNAHAGCFFLNAHQMETWANAKAPAGDVDCSFTGPLESAATLGVMKNFRIYKPTSQCAGFLEIRHLHNRYLGAALRTS